ncbi:MAG: phosphoribosylformylglycinamidine synthase subunit PurS [Acidimicrobiia bacterium]|nr:phosphoribosylformylglycinamidine synthase subunit PurS [Acidimicrobiia bacterium]
MKVTVHIHRRPDIADPQGTTVRRALRDLGFAGVEKVRINRTIELEVEGTDPAAIEAEVRTMCDRLLANPVMEDFEVVVEG